MRIVGREEIEKLASLLLKIRKGYVPPFKPSRLYPPYLFWNKSGTEGSKMYPSMYVTPTLMADAQKQVLLLVPDDELPNIQATL